MMLPPHGGLQFFHSFPLAKMIRVIIEAEVGVPVWLLNILVQLV